ncbi:MAG: alkaline phosphatase family protein [Thermanaerothrix sp.]|uniref:Alkaline phosphatase family protein n=1 Tax=Thermanaerothrix solaris TaxID=3058434 RepID=A0ABU3NSG4_9CHLR|nr:alkaline phosphatase family protein [Thermanaerothrix sp. 4228-RoL]MDT8898791.1 alkaline phosphatase family protein [Thermanaerothrix sp. 4228-RoL]
MTWRFTAFLGANLPIGGVLRTVGLTLLIVLLIACAPAVSSPISPSPRVETPSPTFSPLVAPLTPSFTPSATEKLFPTPTVTATPRPVVPAFRHIVILIFENREITRVIGNPQMPVYNRWASDYTLLTRYYAITRPSLPNYLALIGGDTFGVRTNCIDCYINATSLPDLIEASGRTWKTYQEAMPQPCYLQYTRRYAPKHNPFIYFDPIRTDTERCQNHVVALSDLENDLATGQLPDFAFITPDLCNSGHDCGLDVVDAWVDTWLQRLWAYPTLAKEGLIILTWDEGQSEQGCCGFEPGGGRVATVLISSWVKRGFQDDTPYNHYSLLKTIATAWNLPLLGHAADAQTPLIVAPWEWPE